MQQGMGDINSLYEFGSLVSQLDNMPAFALSLSLGCFSTNSFDNRVIKRHQSCSRGEQSCVVVA